MNLFCFSLEGSMDSLYEPVPEQQANQGNTSVGTGSLISPHGESGKAHANLFMEVSNFENAKPKRKSIRRSMSENKGFERKIANDTTWQEPSKPENDSHIRRLSQLKDLNEEDFLLSNYMHTFQGKKPQGISCQRSSSFGNFDRFRNHSISKPDDSTEVYEGESINENGEQNKTSNNGGSLGKKMRAISWTMKKKVGKKYIKALSEEKDEEDGEDTLPYRNSDPMIGSHTEKISLEASDSMDSLYSGRSSSSGVTSCSDGTSNRDSFRLDDDGPYSGPFCGRARVHTDFTPSPYDTDSLKIKKGDIIDIICKTPMGMWTGMLNNKVGNFKFIYVDVISEEEAAPKKIKAHRRSGKEKPKTLQEFLQRIDLQEYTSTLLLNGYETLEDLKDIKESHLIELNIKNPEDRMRLLSAAENLLDEETIQEQENESVPLSLSPDISLNKSQLEDCPRDSGCYISSENSDNGKEDVESENLSDMVQKITITEPSD
ncbi:SAM domain-containing protein SAMSN-1 isoform X3 [Neofelis nebulosa]|uniref:SAM domain-containing protein SAMSN-1 isoform X3 n=1 Tax=Neofelis nebulosa TaxID=61452 RepID=UPI00272C3441|nr:SAM domain-containing protein SAMSN-1 isoform X3 [Neofelis nebulosa]